MPRNPSRVPMLLDAPPGSFLRLPYVYGPRGYGRAALLAPRGVTLVAIHWPAGSGSPLHGHGASTALVSVVAGALDETRFFVTPDGHRYERETLRAGVESRLGRGAFHRVVAREESWSLHRYEPELVEPCPPPDAGLLSSLRRALEVAGVAETLEALLADAARVPA